MHYNNLTSVEMFGELEIPFAEHRDRTDAGFRGGHDFRTVGASPRNADDGIGFRKDAGDFGLQRAAKTQKQTHRRLPAKTYPSSDRMAENLTHALVRHLDFGRPPSAAFEPSALTDNTSTSSATREAAAGASPPPTGTQRAKVRRTLWASRTKKPEASSEWRPSFRPRHSDRCDSSPQARPFNRFSNIPFFCGRPHMRDGQRFGNLHNVKILLRNRSPGDYRGTSPVDGDFLGARQRECAAHPRKSHKKNFDPQPWIAPSCRHFRFPFSCECAYHRKNGDCPEKVIHTIVDNSHSEQNYVTMYLWLSF